MSRKAKLLGELGLGLIEVTIAGAILAVLVLAFMRINDQMMKSQRRMYEMLEVQELVHNIRYHMANALACTVTLEENFPDRKLPLKGEFYKLTDKNSKTLVEAGREYGSVAVESLVFEASEEEAQNVGAMPGILVYKANIRFGSSGSSSFKKTQSFTIPVFGSYHRESKTFMFEHCDSLNSPFAEEVARITMRNICASMGSKYDPRAGTCDMAGEMMKMMTNPEVMDLSNILKNIMPKR